MYSYPLYRPPSEARSLIIQITEGCSHNKCAFCYMYKDKKFRLKSDEEIKNHVEYLKKSYTDPDRIFIADGDFLALSTDKIIKILSMIKSNFKDVTRISTYGGPKNILTKTDEELKNIKTSGLDMIYMGVESGSDEVLNLMQKGVSADEMREAGIRVKRANFILSCMIISGLGGKDLSKEHGVMSGKIISDISPDYFSLLTLLIEDGSKLEEMVKKGKFKILSSEEVIMETYEMLSNCELKDTVFRSNHPSNYVSLKGTLNKDKSAMMAKLLKHLSDNDYRNEYYRSL